MELMHTIQYNLNSFVFNGETLLLEIKIYNCILLSFKQWMFLTAAKKEEIIIIAIKNVTFSGLYF